jgi:regulator of protease activity HflC (stomatin/prohibitin superfamily)
MPAPITIDGNVRWRVKDLDNWVEKLAAALTNLQKVTAQTALEQARHDYQLDEITTKHDLKKLELELKANISETKADLIKWVVVVGAVQLTIITGLMLRLTGKV